MLPQTFEQMRRVGWTARFVTEVAGPEVLSDRAGWERVFSFDADSLSALFAPAAGKRGDALFACGRRGHGDARGEP